MTDIGESLVAAYMRHKLDCHTIAFNQFLPDRQGEIDVIGISGAGADQHVWLAEVAVHLDGLNYGSYDGTVRKVETKLRVAREYADRIYAGVSATVQFWSPVVPSGLVSRLESLGADELVVNEAFTTRINQLANQARSGTKQHGEEGYRFLQLLTHLRGDRPVFAEG